MRIFLVVLFLLTYAIPLSAQGPNVLIEGLCLTKMEGTKCVYSIEADKAALDNKAVGFFKLALIKVFNLENVYLTLYDNGQVVKKEHFDKAVYEIGSKRLLNEHGDILFVGS